MNTIRAMLIILVMMSGCINYSSNRHSHNNSTRQSNRDLKETKKMNQEKTTTIRSTEENQIEISVVEIRNQLQLVREESDLITKKLQQPDLTKDEKKSLQQDLSSLKKKEKKLKELLQSQR